jgi:hypothetical protein
VSSTLREPIDDVFVDFFPNGESPGDAFVFEGNSISSAGFADGETQGRCQLLPLAVNDLENLYCSITWSFPEGSVVLQGIFFEMIVIGGTGCYSDLNGIVGLEESDDNDVFSYGFVAQSSPPDDCPASLFAAPFLEVGGTTATVDWDENGDSPGDVIVFDSTTLTTPDGDLGFTEGECIYLQDLSDTWCSISFGFGANAEHTLVAQGLFSQMTITGGIGCYNGVTGTISGAGAASGTGFEYALALDAEDSTANCPSDLFDNVWAEPSGEAFVDYDFDDFTAGDVFVFDNKDITIDGEVLGSLAGRCYFLPEVDDNYCNLVFTLDIGTIAVEGFSEEQIIVSGSGCFAGLSGTVETLFIDSEDGGGFEYLWNIDDA